MKKKINKILIALTSAIFSFNTIFADTISDNKVTKGLENFISDLTNWLIGLSLALGVVIGIVCLIMSFLCTDEMERRKWKSHIKTVVICCVLIVTINILLKVIVGYFA